MLRYSLIFSLGLILLLQSCMPTATSRRVASVDDDSVSGDPGGGTGGTGSIVQDDPINDAVEDAEVVTRVELRHFVDPFTETFKPKITIPKNFSGALYIAGINISSLKDKWIYVKFHFGREYETITVPAVIGQAIEGITPATNIEVLILHMENRPFSGLRLPYDLYDYTDYTGDAEPTSDPRDVNLYCRGLNLVDDSSFSGGTSCTAADQTCKFAYAKVLDRALLTNEDPHHLGFPLPLLPSGDPQTYWLAPTTQQVALYSDGKFTSEPFDDALKKCLPDSLDPTGIDLSGINTMFNTNIMSSDGKIHINTPIQTNGALTYNYNGPYQSINLINWQVGGDAIFGPTGVFGNSFSTVADPNFGYSSYLFPRAGKMELQSGIQYLGSEDPFADRSLTQLFSSGPTNWMDGCNIRMSNYDPTTNEGISSCNLTARVEIVAKDPATGVEETRISSKDIKLQIIRDSMTYTEGREFLYSAMKTCDSNNACGAQECCYNDRCWSKDLISACLDDSTGHGDLGIGQSCASDYQCQSLCCNTAQGTCAVHYPTQDPPVYCGKAPGQACVAKEWCQKQNLTQCYIVTTGTMPSGAPTCTLRCYNVPTFPSCIDGRCVPLSSSAPPLFDPANPDCTNAKSPDEVSELLMGI